MYILFNKEFGFDILWNSNLEELRKNKKVNEIILETPSDFDYNYTQKRCKVYSDNNKYYLTCKDKETQEVVDDKIELKLVE